MTEQDMARRLLMDLMGDISEDHWAAGWMCNLEYDLWGIAHGGNPNYGMGSVSDKNIADLLELAEKAEGWPVGDEETHGLRWVSLERFRELYDMKSAAEPRWAAHRNTKPGGAGE